MVLPVNVDTTYADSGTDASVKLHQQHHDSLHTSYNARGSLVVPELSNNPRVEGTAASQGTRAARGVRVRCAIAGTLKAFTYFVGTSSGNVIGWVTDVGEASSGNYSKLWDSGSVAVGTGTAFQNLGDPGLTVVGGQELIFWHMFDNSTATYGRQTNPTAVVYPTTLVPVPAGIADAILGFGTSVATFAAPATIAHALALANTTCPVIIAKIT